MFPLSRYLSANQRFVESKAIIFGNMINIALEKSTNFVEIWLFVYFNTGLVRNIEQINVFLTALGTIFKKFELPSTSQKLKETQGQGSKSRAGLIGQCRQ